MLYHITSITSGELYYCFTLSSAYFSKIYVPIQASENLLTDVHSRMLIKKIELINVFQVPKIVTTQGNSQAT